MKKKKEKYSWRWVVFNCSPDDPIYNKVREPLVGWNLASQAGGTLLSPLGHPDMVRDVVLKLQQAL